MLFEKLKEDRMIAMKAGDKLKSNLLSILIADIQRNAVKMITVPSDTEVLAMIKKFIKNIELTIDIANKASKECDKERTELIILHEYMPKMMTANEMDQCLNIVIALLNIDPENINKEKGKIIGALKKQYGATIDLSYIAKAISKYL